MGDKIDETTDAYIKYIGEYDKANRYYHHWKKSQLSSDEYYSSENCVQLFEKNVGHCTRG
jgi:hypothetical protein